MTDKQKNQYSPIPATRRWTITLAASLLLVGTPSLAQSQNKSKMKANYQGQAAFKVGSSTNAGRLEDRAMRGNYLEISPELKGDIDLSRDLILYSKAEASFKRFTSPDTRVLGDQSNASFKLGTIYFIDDVLEWGFLGAIGYNNARSPYLIKNDVDSIKEIYYQPYARTYLGLYEGDWAFEWGLSSTINRYSTYNTDLLGKQYRSSSNAYGTDLMGEFKFSRSTKIRWKSQVALQQYTERQAEFTDGIPSEASNPHPQADELSHTHSLRLKKTIIGRFKSTTSGDLGFVDDRVFGARDSIIYSASQSFDIPLPWRWELEPAASYSQTNYSNFRANVIDWPEDGAPAADFDTALDNAQNGAKFQPLRKDWTANFSAKLKIPVTREVKIEGQYAFSRSVSNYPGSSYTEHGLEAGFNIKF